VLKDPGPYSFTGRRPEASSSGHGCGNCTDVHAASGSSDRAVARANVGYPFQVGTPAAADDASPVEIAQSEAAPRETVQIGALLIAAALLRTGAVGAGAAVQLDLTDLANKHPSSVVVGLVGAAQAAPEMLFALLLARLADRLGRSRFLVGGPLLGMVGVLCVAAAVRPSQIGVARILEGIGAAAFVPTALGTIAAATRSNASVRAKASSAFEGATLFGYAGGFLLGGFTYHSLHRAAFVVLALFYLSSALVCLRFVPRVPPLPVSPVGVIVRVISGPGPIRAFLPAWLAVNALVGAWYFNVASLLKRAPDPSQSLIHGFDDRVISLFLDGFVVLLIIGIVMWTPLLRRLGAPSTMRWAVPGVYLVCAGLFLINHTPLRLAPVFLPLVVVGVLVEAGFGPAAVNYLADCSEILASDRSALMAFYTVTLAGGGALGAVLGGIAGKLLLFDGLIILAALLATVALFSLRIVVQYERRRAIPTAGVRPLAEGNP
jgi:MFS family permease